MDFKEIPNRYRPVPFWSWNEKLSKSETIRQIRLMNDAGIGGFFMHARGGLQTEYMGDEWFENIETAICEAEKFNMYPWAYDENGWPSGFGNGKVNGLGEVYQQKYLRMEEGAKNTAHTICNNNGMHFYYEVNPFYVDTLDKNVTKKFLELIYEQYYEKFGEKITGFFTDEPQISRNGIPWSLTLPDEYEKEYGENLTDVLIHLFKPVGEYKKTRMKFWRLITKLFSQNYMKQIYDWCNLHNIKYTGHMVLEENFEIQITSNGACMPHYEYFHIPGMDWLGRNIDDVLTHLQVVSAALQTGKKQILSETFALCGHNVSFSELRRIYEWQMVRGINLLCQHLQGYSLRGIRKRDYPPAMYYQQPWWDEYKAFNDSMSRIGMLIAEGKPDCDLLLIHPQTTAWICYDGVKCDGLEEYSEKFKGIIKALEEKHIQFHLGDETLMERHGRVDGKKLIIGEMEYSTIIVPPHMDFFDNTKKLLCEFENNGGRIVSADEILANSVIDNKNITYLKRVHNEFNMHYFVNSTPDYQEAKIDIDGVKLDIMTGEQKGFNKNYTFTPYDSLVIIEYKNKKTKEYIYSVKESIRFDGEWEITDCTENALTLDFCDFYVNNELIEKNMPVTSIQNYVCQFKKEVYLKCVYKVKMNIVPDNICLVCETPDIFKYKINGKEIEFNDIGYFRDISFRKTLISEYLREGENEIELLCNFVQSKDTYENIEKSKIFESERNKLTFDMEIEPVYLVGDFSVKTNGEYISLDRNAVRYIGEFVIDKSKKNLNLENIEQQGYPFFCGSMTLKKSFYMSDTNKKAVLKLKGINAVKLCINEHHVETVIWNNQEIDLSGYLIIGKNEIKLTIYNNLRNLLGPHHLQEGEIYNVRPASFYKGNSLWGLKGNGTLWDDNYCFAEVSILP